MIKNLILLTGQDSFRLQERVKFYREAFRNKYPDGEIETFEVSDALSALENAVFTPNLFGGKRLVFLDQFWDPDKFEQAQKQKFFDQLPDFEDASTIICIEPTLDKRKKYSKFLADQAKSEIFDPLEKNEVVEWMIRYAEKSGGTLKRTEALFLLDRCGLIDWSQVKPDFRTKKVDWNKVRDTFGHAGENLWNLSQEITKLVSAGDGLITQELIEAVTVPNVRGVIWDFLEALSARNTKKALNNFQELIQMGQSPFYLFSMIQRELRVHAQLRWALDQKMSPKAIASETGLHPFVVQKNLANTKNFSLSKIEQLYDQCFDIDQKIKTGGIQSSDADTSEFELALEKFILEMTR